MEMDGSSTKEEACCPKLLDFISKEREWLAQRDGSNRRHGPSDENKLELRLGLPGHDDDQRNHNWSSTKNNPIITNNNSSTTDRDESLLSLSYFSSPSMSQHNINITNNHDNKSIVANSCQDQKQKQVLLSSSSWSGCLHQQQHHHHQQLKSSSFLQYQTSSGSKMLPPPALPPPPAVTKESSQLCCNRIVDLQSPAQKKTFSPSPANTAVPNTSQKRAAPAPVVGWPPIRSFRKNLASTSASTKPASEPHTTIQANDVKEEKPAENHGKGLFVKINMDGVAIGRKVDLHAYDSYEKLSSSVDELFRGLLAAQRDSSSVGGVQKKKAEEVEEKPITAGILDGTGEYTLTYEDNEGDRMLVGDVPWHMFVSTVKRLRVLKSSELSSLSRAGGKALLV